MHSKEIRARFLDFFQRKGHRAVASAPMVVRNDPTLMFTNAGMNQFKDFLLGNSTPPVPRICDAQKCLRVSGKQNDLEEVGHDTYHHTMFEMLGNWSFGDYFKAEAIAWAWELLVDEFGIPADRLYVTVFEGSEAEGVPLDEEARSQWARFVPPERILLGARKDNFWEMGETGPCGPCSEIHIDLRPEAERALTPGRELVNRDHPRVIEIWNLVFMQYNRLADGHLEPLPQRHIDTGMGFERLCMVLQGKESNYDTDLFQPLIQRVSGLASVAYGTDAKVDVALRVIADHVRAVAFSIADGQLPSNNKAGYVIRRILRRAVRYGYSFLGFRQPFLCRLVPELVRLMGESYPELVKGQELITRVIQEEEAAFLRTLAQGIQLLEQEIQDAKGRGSRILEGQAAFTLYDTYGFPLDLTELMLREHGMGVDQEGFASCMAQQKARSRLAGQVKLGDWTQVHPEEPSVFMGYDHLEAQSRILRMREVVRQGKKQCQLVLDASPFYAEGGGQVGDSGSLTSPHERIEVLDTIRENGLPVCIVSHFPDHPEAVFHAGVNAQARLDTARHHTATHLLHHALREVLGTHVEQRGSLVEPHHLRFDFSHFQRMDPEEIRRVEERVNDMIRDATPCLEHRDLPIEQARSMGAMALFGEKYGDRVRVINFGDSTELCGGTHVTNTGAIGFFRIVSEGAISAGIRRIVAVAGRAAELRDYQLDDDLSALDTLLQAQGKPLDALRRLQDENHALKQQLDQFRRAWLDSTAHDLAQKVRDLRGMPVVAELLAPMPAEDLRELALALRTRSGGVTAILGSPFEGKPALVVAIPEAWVKDRGLNAGALIRSAASFIQGGGGGQAGFATAGGRQPQGLQEAIDHILSVLDQ